MKKRRKFKPPRETQIARIVHISYTSDYLNYVGHCLKREEKGEAAESYSDYLERVELKRWEKKFTKLTTEELLRRLNKSQPRSHNDC